MEIREIEKRMMEYLQELSQTCFPKTCSTCGTVYPDLKSFLRQTVELDNSETENNETAVHLCRNCRCGSTLMAVFENRRDTSPAGIQFRNNFGHLMEELIIQGYSSTDARSKVCTILRTHLSKPTD